MEGVGLLQMKEGAAGTRVGEVGCRAVHERHEGIPTNTWRASTRVRLVLILGRICADLDLGPETKFEARELLFIFHLGTMVIRAVD